MQAVKEVSLDIPDHAFVTLLGPSGCGKTTTLNLIAGLEKVTRGDILLDNQRITDWAPHERGMAMVFQNYALYPHMNVYGNMAFALKLLKRPKAEIDARVRRVAKALELDALLERRISQLSGGQQQRVALGRAMVKEPKVFLFDEPLSNLDAALRTRMRIEIKKLHQQLEDDLDLCHARSGRGDDALRLHCGDARWAKWCSMARPRRSIAGRTIFTWPPLSANRAWARSRGNLRVTNDRVEYQAGDLRLAWPNAVEGQAVPPLEAQATLGIRAEDVQFITTGAEATASGLRGEVGLLEPLGSDTYVEVNRGPITITGRVEPDRRLRLGDKVVLELPRQKLHFFDTATGERLNV